MSIDTRGILNGYYFAFVLEEVTVDAEDHQTRYYETSVLVRADSEQEARQKLKDEHPGTSYQNRSGETVSWKLVDLLDISSVMRKDLENFTELHARSFTDYESYRRGVDS
jgi:hypothetical protein